MCDKNIWNSIGGKNFCSFKLISKTQSFCKNTNNATGLCNEESCPLANSKYATVREDGEKLFLFVKEPERVHQPNIAFEKIALSDNYQTAILEIEKELEYWDPLIIHKCKQRLTKLTEYLRRKKNMNVVMTSIKKKQTKGERIGAMKSLNKVNFEKAIENELYQRLELGIYGDELKEKYQKKVYQFEESDEDILAPLKKKRNQKKEKTRNIKENQILND